MEFKYMENTKYLILALIGMVMACMGLLTYILQPIELIIDSMTTLRAGSVIYHLWTQPPVDVVLKIYVFNVTNPEEFLAGKEQLRVKEIGPYTYKEVLKNTESTFNDNGTLTFKPVREYTFLPEMSIGVDSEDYLIVPNVPLLGIGSMLSSFNPWVNLGFNMMIGNHKQFVNLTVKDYMWGYEDRLVSLASTFVPSWIDFPTFGIMDRLTSRDAGNVATIYLNDSYKDPNHIAYKYSVNEFNGSPGLKQWDYVEVKENETSESNTPCNTVRGSYEGGLFPRYLKKNETIRMYRDAFCRPVNLLYENETTTKEGYAVYSYRVDENFLQSGDENPDNKCYCKKGVCLPNGLNTLAPCYYGIPIVISLPHFMNVDQKVANKIEGLNPDREKHDIVAQISPDLGIPLSCQLRVQVNLQVDENRILSKLKPFKNLFVPLCWIELDISEPTPVVKYYLNLIMTVAPIIESILIWVLGLFGLSLISVSALIILYFPPTRRLEDPFHRIGYSPILVIPLSSRLKAENMRIS